MFKVCARFFRKKSPLFEASHRVTLPKQRSITGTPFKSERLYDPDKLQRLQNLVHEQTHTPGISLTESVKKLAKTDKEFNEFLKNFKTNEEPQWASLLDSPNPIDLKTYLKDPKKKAQDRLDELHMHDQLRKKMNADKLHEQARMKSLDNEFTESQLKGDRINPGKATPMNDEVNRRYMGNDVFFNWTGFKIMFLDAGSSTLITKLARVSSRRVLLYMGNCDGIVSYGKGQGLNYQIAYNEAVKELKKNLICIDLDHFVTFPSYLQSRFNDTHVELIPSFAQDPWGDPCYYNILALAGLNHFKFRIRCRHFNRYSIIYCIFDILSQNTTPRLISQLLGKKIYQIAHGKGLKTDYDPSVFSV